MGFYGERVHGREFEKCLRRYGSRKASSCILQVILARWAALFSVIIVLVARVTQR